MGKIRKFTRKTVELDASDTLREIEYIHSLLESREALIRYVIEDSKERFRPINRVIGKMKLLEDNFVEQIRDNGYPIAFRFLSESGYDYLVTLLEPEEDDDDRYELECILTHPLQDGFEIYDWEKNNWNVVNRGGKWIEDILKEDSVRSAFLECIINTGFARSTQLIKESFDAMCEKYSPIMELYERLEGLMEFDHILTGADLDGTIGLIPADDKVSGIAVQYEDGRFRVLQYLEDVFICFACDEAQADYPDNDLLYVPVYTCDNAEDAEKVLRMTLDHYHQEETCVLPLSDRHYIQTPNPFLSLETVMGKEGELTEQEEMRVSYLENFFRKQ